jgi:LPS-assembly lipoprotein
MWLRRGILVSLVLASAAAPLAGCGFRPLYGTASSNAAGAPVDRQMAGVRIAPIPDRLGQQLHNALRDQFNPLGQPGYGDYSLNVVLVQRTYGALARRDLSASRRNVDLTAAYTLTDAYGTVLLQDQSEISTGYDEFDDPLNDISAFEDAERRSTLQLAEMIRTRVAVFLTAGTKPPAAPPAAAPTTAPADPVAAPGGTTTPSTTAP